MTKKSADEPDADALDVANVDLQVAVQRAKKRWAVIGWREWVSLPEFGVGQIKAKVDTGARTSALHAINIHYVSRHGSTVVRFDVHPKQRDTKKIVRCEAPLIEERHITDSGGKRTLRPVIEATLELFGETFKAELTLVSRDEMGFRMLLGRQAIKSRFLVNPGRSYLAGRARPTTKIKRKKKAKQKP